MKKSIILPLLCSLFVGGSFLTSNEVINFNNVIEEKEDDILVYEGKLEGESKSVKKFVIGDETTAFSKTMCQYGTTADGHHLIRFATAVKGNLTKLTYSLTYLGVTETHDIQKVYKGITVEGKTTYYDGTKQVTTDPKAGYYWACITVEYKSEKSINVGLTAELTITDNEKTYTAAKKSTSLGIIRDGCENAFDGYMNDPIWTDEVKAKPHIVRDDSISKITAYATKGEKGIYVFVDYAAISNSSTATKWWEGNNFEATFTGKNGVLVNKNEFDMNVEEYNRVQCWTSQHSGTRLHNWSDGYLSALTKDETTDMYKMTFEMFMAYEDLGYVDGTTFTSITKDNIVGIGIGSPIQNNGADWKNTKGYRNEDLTTTPKITQKGIYENLIPEAECAHDYGDWSITTQPDCGNDGEKERTCLGCGHKETDTVTSTGNHNYDTNNLTIVTPSTCKTQGIATAPCTGGCGSTTNVKLPLDSNNHEQEYDESLGYYPCCGEHIKDGNPIVNSINNNQWGWNGISSWTFIAKNLKGDYNVTVKYTSKTNLNLDIYNNNVQFAHTLAVVEEQLADGVAGYGSVWVNRLDWWQWCDQWQSSSLLTEQNRAWNDEKQVYEGNGGILETNKNCWAPNWDNDYMTTYSDCSITLTFTRTGKTVRNEYVITSNTTGKSYTYWTQITDVDASKNLSLALVAECATFTISSIKYNSVTFA